MRLLSAEFENFRNIERANIEFAPHFTALIGPNGQGKTNVLEGLYLACALRSLRNVPRKALIRSNSERAQVTLEVLRADTGLTHDMQYILQGQTRALMRDGKRVESSSFLGTAVAVVFTPDDLQLAKGGPDGRRRFLDRAVLNLKPGYLGQAMRYAKAIRDRNRILVERGSDEMLDAFDQVIAEDGAAIMVQRAQYVQELGPRLLSYFERIGHPAPLLEAHYEATLKTDFDLESIETTQTAFLSALQKRRSHDRLRRTTSIGPHLDDLKLLLDGKPAKHRASQGQHRALVLSLKLAEIDHLRGHLGESPILLLDDMSSELDSARSRQLFEAVSHLEGQVILTSTHSVRELQAILGADPVLSYNVEAGTLCRSTDPT